jgi:uncharacterized protein with HEPN domain
MRERLGDKQRLNHAIDAISDIQKFVEGVNFEQFESNLLLLSACLHKLEVIGEACNRLSTELVESNSDVPWRSIVGLRNMIAHEYFGIDTNTIWSIIQYDLIELSPKLEHILDTLVSD